MDIVDTQIHLFAGLDDDAAVPIMDALGIRSALIDELWQSKAGVPAHALMPSYRLPGGQYRVVSPGGQLASMRRPDRFSYLLRINPDDPGMAGLMDETGHIAGFRAFRIVATKPEELAAAAAGGFMAFFESARRVGAPVFVGARGSVIAAFEQYVRACPALPIVFDHCGMLTATEEFDDLLRLAQYENVHIKWSHAPIVFNAGPYPFPEVRPWLARALDAFGPDRIMWASDFSVIPYMRNTMYGAGPLFNWSEALYYLRDDPTLSEGDKAWLLGRTARKVLRWDIADEPGA